MNKSIFLLLIVLTTFGCKTTPEARKPISATSGSFIKESVERNKQLFQNEKVLIESIIAKDSTATYKASENGFWYAIITASAEETPKPAFGDIVNFDYEISGLNGTIIYSAEALKTKNYAMDKEELFSGLREGLKLMKAGETFKFIFPSQKAYGYYGDENKIGTNVPIQSKVTVNTIIKK